MSDRGTALSEGQLAEFVGAGARALTLIAAQLGPELAENWSRNGEAMQKAFLSVLGPSAETAPAALGPSMETAAAVLPDRLILAVDYAQSLEQMIAAGHYGWANSDIGRERFAIKGVGRAEFEARLFHFDHGSSSDGAVDAIKNADPADPWEPAKIEHLLAFGAKFPEEQRKYPIVALGSVVLPDGPRHVPYLYKDDSRRHLHLTWWALDWPDDARFLAVRKLASAS